MNKVYSVLFLTVLFSCSSVPKSDSNYHSFDEALEISIQKIENDLPEGSDIAILDFKSDNSNLSSYIIEEMYDKLINGGKLPIMERSRTDTIKREVGYQLSGEVDDNEIINIGHQLGADYVVTGQITFSGEAYRLRIFAIDIAKGRRVASSSLNIKSNDRQINYLITSKTNENTQVINTNNNAKNEDILYEAVQGLLKRIPKNSRVLIAGITGSNELKTQYIQTTIANEAKDILIITEDQRTASMEIQKKFLSGEYSYDSVTIGDMDGASIIVTGGVFGTGESRRIVFRALDVEKGLIVSESCVLFTQNNTELINNVEALSQRINNNLSKNIRNDSSIAVINNVGTSRNGDFVFDMIENNLVNLSKYKVVTRSELELIREEQKFQMSGWVSVDTAVMLGNLIGAQYILNIEYTNGKIQVTVFDENKGISFMQETM
jgi:curli biogenesis system outer membrane secretion channel CsgG